MRKRYVPSARHYDNGTMIHIIVLANTEFMQPTISKTAARTYISEHTMYGIRSFLMQKLEATGAVSWYSNY